MLSIHREFEKSRSATTGDYDALVIGAGFAGLYQLQYWRHC